MILDRLFDSEVEVLDGKISFYFSFCLSFPYSVDGMPEMAVFLLGLYSNCLFVRNRYLPIAFDKGNEGILSVVPRIVQVECE